MSSLYNKYIEITQRINTCIPDLNKVCSQCTSCCTSYAWAFSEEINQMLQENIKTAKSGNCFFINSFKKDKNGDYITHEIPNCIYYYRNKCDCYDVRPLYCRLYPVILHPLERVTLLKWDTHCTYVNGASSAFLEKTSKKIVSILEVAHKELLAAFIEMYSQIYNISPGLESENHHILGQLKYGTKNINIQFKPAQIRSNL